MTLTENKKILTETAWNKLYERFEEEHLLPAAASKQKHPRANSLWIKWTSVAAIVFVVFTAGVFLFKNNQSKQQKPLLTISNTDSKSIFVKILEDGSTVFLAADALISYPTHFESDKREIHLKGEAFFDISKNETSPFIIETEFASIKVLGTAFNINVDKEHFSMAVQKGEVIVNSKKTKQSINVKGSEKIVLTKEGLFLKELITDQKLFDKYTNNLYFKDAALLDIIHVLNKSKDADLVLSPEIESISLTVTFSPNDSVDKITEIICEALNLKHTYKEGRIYISKSE